MSSFEGTYTLTATNEATAVSLVKFVRSVLWRGDTMLLNDALVVARSIQAGSYTMDAALFNCDLESNDLVHVEKHVVENPWTAHFNYAHECFELMERGAAGDAEAAIAYCKRELEGKVPHGPMG